MAKKPAVPFSAKVTAKKLRKRTGGPTFIQRSRSISAEEKATFHNVTGAGKSRVKRPFFEIGVQDGEAIKKATERLLQARIDKAES